MGWGYGPQWGMMGGGWGGYGWGGPFHLFFGLLILILVVVLVIWLFRSGSRGGEHGGRLERRSPGLDVLEERYARGEINRDEYLQKKRDITG